MADVLTYVRGLNPGNLIGAAFGAYGWSGEGPDQVSEYLEQITTEVVGDTIKAQYMATDEDLEACRQLGSQVALKLKEQTKVPTGA